MKVIHKDVSIRYLQKYSSTLSKRSIAKIMWEENPDQFPSWEYARTALRYYTGNQGKKSRVNEGSGFFAPHPEEEITDLFYDIADQHAKVLLLGDIHVPFQDKKALDIAVDYGVKHGADIVVLNGDIFDHYTESSHEKDYRKRDPEYDYEQYQEFMYELRCAFPDQKIIMKRGNHERRYELWFVRNRMGDMLNIPHFEYEKIMNFAEYEFYVIEDYVTITCGGLNVIHGHEYRGGGGVSPARWLSLRTRESAMCGHFHKTSEHTTKKHRGDIQTYWSVGCLCNLTPRYMPYNDWNHGFAFIIKEDESFFVKNKRIYGKMLL